jgi:hypothetical protein
MNLICGPSQHLDRYFQVNVNFFLCPSEGMAAPFSILPWFMMWPTYRTFLSLLMFVCSIPLCFGYVWAAKVFRSMFLRSSVKGNVSYDKMK